MDRPENPRTIRLTGTEQHEHDTLAELFLGGAPFAPAPMSTPMSTPISAESSSQKSGQPLAQTTPAASKPAAAQGAPETNPGNDHASKPAGRSAASRYEGSAVRTIRPDDSSTRDTGRPIVEMVVLGHLPVRASLWVRQYACLSARKRLETVALVRTAGHSVAIDVITGGERAEIEPVDSIEDAMTIARSAAARIVVRVDETAEPELLERAGVDEVTILTGADEAAVVASYRLIKSLVSSLGNRLDPDASPVLRVAVMGGAGDDIPAACMKIERACKAFLERPIEILDASGRIDATGTTSVCRIERAGIAAEAISLLLPLPAAEEGTRAGTALRLALQSDDDVDSDTHGETQRAMPEVVIMPGLGVGGGAGMSAGIGSVTGIGRGHASEIEAKPGAGREAASLDHPASGELEFSEQEALTTTMRPVPKLGLRLPELIEGLVPLETRCPKARGVWFAADAQGGLHAVVSGDADNCVADLVAARAWAMDNLALLLRAEPALAMPSADQHADGGVVLHMLTRGPARWHGVLDSEVLVYAVGGVNVGGQDHLVATLLNG